MRSRVVDVVLGRTRARRTSSAVALAFTAAVIVEACAIEPYALDVTRHEVRAPLLREPLVVAHVTDLHTHGFGRHERLLVARIEEMKPDLVVVTGDTVDTGSLEPARALFERMHAPLGVFVVHGNWEHWKPPGDERAFYASVGATLLVNEGRLLRDDVWLAGLDDPLAGAPDLSAALRDAPEGTAKVVLFHSPDIFDSVAPRLDITFAGHTHGGQVRLPFVGALWTPPGSGRFVSGWYEAGGARMYVSRGVGTSIINARFLCKPELAIVKLVPR